MRSHFLLLLAVPIMISSCGGNNPPPRVPQTGAYERTPQVYIPVRPENSSEAASNIPAIVPPIIFGESAIAIDVATGAVLFAKNPDSLRPVASTQKIITALCVLDAGDLNKVVTIQASDNKCEPTKIGIRPGERYTRDELLRALMVKSANNVARALARDVGGSVENFANLMNQKAQSLGMRNSHFMNPHGLTVSGQYSTARDMAIATRTAYRSSALRSYTSTKSFTFRYNNGKSLVLTNTNKLLKNVPYCNGFKTGTTNAAGRCLVSTGTLNGRSVICVVLNSNTPHIWIDSENLLRWALESPIR